MKKFEEAIVNELLLILFLLRVGAFIGLLLLFWFTPVPWKAIVMAPFVVPPLMVLGEQMLQRLRGPAEATCCPAQDAERRRLRAIRARKVPGGAEHTLAKMIEQLHNRRPA